MKRFLFHDRKDTIFWAALCSAVWLTYALVLYEWMFQYTKISFLDSYPLVDVISIPMTVPLVFMPFSLIPIFTMYLIEITFSKTKFNLIGKASFLFWPSILATVLLFFMLDNFTYTVFGFNAGSGKGLRRFGYLILLFIFFIFSWNVFSKRRWIHFSCNRWMRRFTIGVFTLSIFVSLFIVKPRTTTPLNYQEQADYPKPNIVIFSTDGLDAAHLSVYGYNRDTTPFLNQLAEESLVFKNVFPNCSNTTGSVFSLFTGKTPIKTRMVYPPDTLKNEDAYQHLPGILRQIGYQTVDISIRHYADPRDRGLLDGFDYANGRSLRTHDHIMAGLLSFSPIQSLFFDHLVEGIGDRLLHVFGVADYFNSYLAVVGLQGARRYFPDTDNMDLVYDFIEKSGSAPLFMHVHLLGTHGPYFFTKNQRFSKGKVQSAPWMDDFYDDAILRFDRFSKTLVALLKDKGMFEKTIFVVTSDHGSRWNSLGRIPLIIRFPKKEFIGQIEENAQLIDIGPTALAFLGIPQPPWMEGQSLLSFPLPALRPIFTAEPIEWGPMTHGWRNVSKYKPPFYSLGKVNIILNHIYFSMDLRNGSIQKGTIEDHTAVMSETHLPSQTAATQIILDYLDQHHYDTKAIRKNLQQRRS